MATVVENIAMQVAGAIGRSGAQSVLVTGGGALNRSLILRVKHHTVASLTIPEIRLVKFKEAMVFALLGVLRILGEVNCLASATGAPYDLSAGTIHQP
jgi:anhydro-N-acetylmuramic acid kinase